MLKLNTTVKLFALGTTLLFVLIAIGINSILRPPTREFQISSISDLPIDGEILSDWDTRDSLLSCKWTKQLRYDEYYVIGETSMTALDKLLVRDPYPNVYENIYPEIPEYVTDYDGSDIRGKQLKDNWPKQNMIYNIEINSQSSMVIIDVAFDINTQVFLARIIHQQGHGD